ncbi:wall-associated receptor kinase-like 18 [Telopea speciosissima]|uniref:wall-associated receptor kinase-like 18 n=1 Tax=Telopea speciosissima TaxID=54955 RepID=UPI001CC71B59|nr:wall-associated receptor kinase-like 18 [Telopea speciosissima]
MKKATHHFCYLIRKGDFGEVYWGESLLGEKNVAIMKPADKMDEDQIIQFVNEVDILSQGNHEHVVKLLGCCLDNEDPMLVYEFFSASSLSLHIHGEKEEKKHLSWIDRLRIAEETAEALDHLHSSHPVSIFHRNVTSSTILLDDKMKSKVSDFGVSGFGPVPLAETENNNTSIIQGNRGQPESGPEYSHAHTETHESDVYSFGVVLAELLTGKKRILSEEPGKKETLAKYFVREVTDVNLCLDEQIKNDAEKDHFLKVVKLTKKCLQDKGEARPTMKEVASMLGSLLSSLQPKQEQQTEHRDVGGPSTSSILDATADEIEAVH